MQGKYPSLPFRTCRWGEYENQAASNREFEDAVAQAPPAAEPPAGTAILDRVTPRQLKSVDSILDSQKRHEKDIWPPPFTLIRKKLRFE